MVDTYKIIPLLCKMSLVPWVVHYAAIALQASAHRLHSSAHILQCSIPCCACVSHSVAQASQTDAQNMQNSLLRSLLRLINSAAVRQIAAHSKLSCIQLVNCFTISSFKQAIAHWLHTAAHARHALIHSANFLSIIIFIFTNSLRAIWLLKKQPSLLLGGL